MTASWKAGQKGRTENSGLMPVPGGAMRASLLTDEEKCLPSG